MHIRVRCPSQQLHFQLSAACSSTDDDAVLVIGVAATAAPVRGPESELGSAGASSAVGLGYIEHGDSTGQAAAWTWLSVIPMWC